MRFSSFGLGPVSVSFCVQVARVHSANEFGSVGPTQKPDRRAAFACTECQRGANDGMQIERGRIVDPDSEHARTHAHVHEHTRMRNCVEHLAMRRGLFAEFRNEHLRAMSERNKRS